MTQNEIKIATKVLWPNLIAELHRSELQVPQNVSVWFAVAVALSSSHLLAGAHCLVNIRVWFSEKKVTLLLINYHYENIRHVNVFRGISG